MNLIHSFTKEKNLKNQEAIFSALSSVIKADNFAGKLRFIKEFDGLNFLASLLCDELLSDSLRLYRRVLVLLNDLVNNDSDIDPSHPMLVRNFLGDHETCLVQCFKNLSEDYHAKDLTNH